VFSGQVVYPLAGAGEHLRFFRDFMAGAPEELQCYPFFFRVPPLDVFPAETHGSPVIDFVFCHQDPAAGYVVRPLRELGDPVLDVAGETAYVDTQQAFDANLPKGARYLSKAHNLTALSDGVIATILEHVPGMTGDLTSAYLDPQGGAVGRIDVPATPFAGRDAGYGFHIIAGWTDAGDDGTVGAWATGLHDAMAAHATGGVYVSLIGDDEPGRVPAAYGPNYGRLVELKRRWDPDNVFAGNYNIPPG
jgi:hypothetical protein